MVRCSNLTAAAAVVLLAILSPHQSFLALGKRGSGSLQGPSPSGASTSSPATQNQSTLDNSCSGSVCPSMNGARLHPPGPVSAVLLLSERPPPPPPPPVSSSRSGLGGNSYDNLHPPQQLDYSNPDAPGLAPLFTSSPQPRPPPPPPPPLPSPASFASKEDSNAKKAGRDVGLAFLVVGVVLQVALGSYLFYKRRTLGIAGVRLEKTPTSPPARSPGLRSAAPPS